tara:strand:- start:2701 stop:3900 length:1200 start_codon:yes stop_codon:yes gene_type:complete
MRFIIWHDNDYDFAKWVYKNSILKNENVYLQCIPKTNNSDLISKKLVNRYEYDILPFIKFATPDIIIQKVEKNFSKIIFVSEFMTHTPQHDHVFQRFERIYCSSNQRVPTAFVLPFRKSKLEKGGARTEYRQVSYKPNPLAIHTYIKTSHINKTPTLMYFWPEKNGYLKYDSKHQTAPKIEEDILKWFEFLNNAVSNKNQNLYNSSIVKERLDYLEKISLLDDINFSSIKFNDFILNFKSYYNLSRVNIISTNQVIRDFKLDPSKLSNEFLSRKKSLIFKYSSKQFRTDPYCGFIAGFENLFCKDYSNIKQINLIHYPKGIKYLEVSKVKRGKDPTFKEINEDLNNCPLHSVSKMDKESFSNIKQHIKKCVYTKSKQQRIFGTISDIVVFDDFIFYNND